MEIMESFEQIYSGCFTKELFSFLEKKCLHASLVSEKFNYLNHREIWNKQLKKFQL